MESSLNQIYLDQAYLIYYGRVIYNYGNRTNEINIFRDNGSDKNDKTEPKLAAKVTRSFSNNCTNICEAIFFKRIVDISILYEIQIVGKNNVCNSTYINYFKFPYFSSNIENYYFSKNGLKIAHIGSLSSYSQINFSCFDVFSNAEIKNILKFSSKIVPSNDNDIESKNSSVINDDDSLKLSQMIGLFLCETSRNPTTFFTIPMCLEIGEKFFGMLQKKETIGAFKDGIQYIHNNSSIYKDLIAQKEELEKKVNETNKESDKKELRKLVKSIESKFIDIHHENINSILKSDIIKDIILNLFPLSMGKAVPASRYISNEINTNLQINYKSNIFHQYDYDKGSIQDAIKLLNIERNLIDTYNKYITTENIIEDIAKNWFNIDITPNDISDIDNITKISNWLVGLSKDFDDIMDTNAG